MATGSAVTCASSSSPADRAVCGSGRPCRGESRARRATRGRSTVNGTAIASDSMLGASSVPAKPSTVKRSSTAPAPKKIPKQPNRQVAVMGALHGDGEFRIGEGEIDDGAQPVALDLVGDEMADNLGDRQHAHRDPECLAADAAVKAVEKIEPNPSARRRLSIPQQFVDAGLGARLLVDALDDDGAGEARARLRRSCAACPAWLPGTTTE